MQFIARTKLVDGSWLDKVISLQKQGLTGNLEVAGFPFDQINWDNDSKAELVNDGWWPFEQTGYWDDAYVRVAFLSGDPDMITRIEKIINYVIDNAKEDGYLGPAFMKDSKWTSQPRWAHAVFFRALLAYSEYVDDEKKQKIFLALQKHYLGDSAVYADNRDICNIEIMLAVYEETKNFDLLVKSVQTLLEYNKHFADKDNCLRVMLSDKRASEHGVTFCELGKIPAILAKYLDEKNIKKVSNTLESMGLNLPENFATICLQSSLNGFYKIQRDQMLIDGVPSSTEHLRGRSCLDSHEICDIADYTWSAGHLLCATNDFTWADKIEKAVFNAGLGAVTKDFKATQYFSCPNQIIADHESNHNDFFKGGTWMAYAPKPATECCTANVNRIIPNYIARMWVKLDGRGLTRNKITVDGKQEYQSVLVNALLGPSQTNYKVQTEKGVTPVNITCQTSYPFSDKLQYHFNIKSTDKNTRFPFAIRIPQWCQSPVIELNGSPIKTFSDNNENNFRLRSTNGQVESRLLVIERNFCSGDILTVYLPSKIEVKKNFCSDTDAIAICKGPLVFALPIKPNVLINTQDKNQSKDFPSYDLYPASKWNFAFNPCENIFSKDCVDYKIIQGDQLQCFNFTDKIPHISIMCNEVLGYCADKTPSTITFRNDDLGFYTEEIFAKMQNEYRDKNTFIFTPKVPQSRQLLSEFKISKPSEITLIPLGLTLLRITIFPVLPGFND